jgi:hypothetical protein
MELFTSQGCSSCPAADALMEQLSEKYSQPNFIFLAYHVDYWDNLGWRDIFGSSINSTRQKEYARSLSASGVYTPQVFINARQEFIGGRAKEIEAAIRHTAAHSGVHPLAYTIRNMRIYLSDSIQNIDIQARKDISVLLISCIPDSTVAVKRGENGGREIHYSHIVNKITTYPFDKQSFIDTKEINPVFDNYILVQNRKSKRIYGATKLRKELIE